jgi:3-hydroxyacyl-CoA dehydrogenase
LPVYQRQLFPERLLGEARASVGPTLWENGDAQDGVKVWHLPDIDARVGIISFKSKMNSVSRTVLDGLQGALTFAEANLDAVVLWNAGHFSVGANLKEVLASAEAGEWDALDGMIRNFQAVSTKIRDALVPTVAAVSGLAYGGGCEFAMHARHRVVALESQMGLVEAAVGVIPAGGGCRLFAEATNDWANAGQAPELMSFVEKAFKQLSHAEVARNAHQAIAMGFMKASDDVVFQPGELLYVAIRRARSLAEVGAAPARRPVAIRVAGREGLARLEGQLTQLREGGQISDHDVRVSRAIAWALCGGDVDADVRVDEAWLLDQERIVFIDLLKEPLTRARIAHMLEHGKALRN